MLFDIESICANSYRDFHTKGFDYLCLSRGPELTRKVYFFEGNLADLPELVIPHDHRYPFVSTVLAGAVRNLEYAKLPRGVDEKTTGLARTCGFRPFDRFEYRTPLNGGRGFSWSGVDYLQPPMRSRVHTRGSHYRSQSKDIHTLDIRSEGTVLLLEQMADDVPVDVPTSAWRPEGDREPPSLSGLYSRMDPDHARKRISQFLDLIGNR